jgi:hypothetical protein
MLLGTVTALLRARELPYDFDEFQTTDTQAYWLFGKLSIIRKISLTFTRYIYRGHCILSDPLITHADTYVHCLRGVTNYFKEASSHSYVLIPKVSEIVWPNE